MPTEQFDPQLRRLFAHAREPLAGDAFLAAVLRRVMRERRSRYRRRLIAAAVLFLIACSELPVLLAKTALIVRFLGEYSTTPVGWAVSMMIGGWVLLWARAIARS